jgi:hypothetical protein
MTTNRGTTAQSRAAAQTRVWALAATAGALAITIWLLRSEGRLWICTCGKLSLWAGQVCSANNSQQFLDPFSFTHVLHGFALLNDVWPG